MHITGEAMERVGIYMCRGVVIVMKWAETSVITLDLNAVILRHCPYIQTISDFLKAVHHAKR
jgi:hypothetical protein